MTIRPAYGVSSSGVVDGSITLADLADPGGMPVVRRGAKFGAASGNASVSWAPSSSAYSIVWKMRRDVGSVGTFQLISGNGSGKFLIRSATNGIVVWIDGGAANRTVTVSAADQEEDAEYVLAVNGATASLSRNGVLIDAWVPAGTTTTSASTIRIGEGYSVAAFPGVIWDVEFTDPASPTNSAYFPLDGRNAAGEYPNAYAAGGSRDQGSLVGDAVVSGFVEDVVVTSTESGGGGAVAAKECYLHSGFANSTQAVDGSVSNPWKLQLSDIYIDETGGLQALDDDIFVAPCDGMVDMTAVVSLAVNADSADDVTLSFRVGISSYGECIFQGGSRAEASSETVAAVAPIASGEPVELWLGALGAGTTVNVLRVSLTLRFHPTRSAS